VELKVVGSTAPLDEAEMKLLRWSRCCNVVV